MRGLVRVNHLFTPLLRRFKDQTYPRLLDTTGDRDARASLATGEGPRHDGAPMQGATGRREAPSETQASHFDESLDSRESSQDPPHDYIEASKMKRSTEAFHTTYRNPHSIERTSDVDSVDPSGPEETARVSDRPTMEGPAVENHVQPVPETIGYNQSTHPPRPVTPLSRASR